MVMQVRMWWWGSKLWYQEAEDVFGWLYFAFGSLQFVIEDLVLAIGLVDFIDEVSLVIHWVSAIKVLKSECAQVEARFYKEIKDL